MILKTEKVFKTLLSYVYLKTHIEKVYLPLPSPSLPAYISEPLLPRSVGTNPENTLNKSFCHTSMNTFYIKLQ